MSGSAHFHPQEVRFSRPAHSTALTMASTGDQSNASTVLCFTCGEFVLASEYDSHVTSVHWCPIECLICKEMVDIDDFEEHLSHFHIEKTQILRCTICSSFFTGQKNFDAHIEECGQHLCDLCGRFLNLETYKLHISTGVHDVKMEKIDGESDKSGDLSTQFNCEMLHMCHCCESLFKVKEELVEHMAEAHKDRIWYTCSPCRVAFRSRDAFHEHLNSHSATVPSDKVAVNTDLDVVKVESEKLEDLNNYSNTSQYENERNQHFSPADTKEEPVQSVLESPPDYTGNRLPLSEQGSSSSQTRCGQESKTADKKLFTVGDLLKLTQEVRSKEAMKGPGVLKMLWHVGTQTGNDILSRRTHVLASCKIPADDSVTTADKCMSVSEKMLKEAMSQWKEEVQTGRRLEKRRTFLQKVGSRRNMRRSSKEIFECDETVETVQPEQGFVINWDRGIQTGVDEVSSLLSACMVDKTKKVTRFHKSVDIIEKDIVETMQLTGRVFEKISNERLERHRSAWESCKSLPLEKHARTRRRPIYICSLCNDIFLHRKKLLQHLKNHPCYICECQSVFVNMETYESHLQNFSEKSRECSAMRSTTKNCEDVTLMKEKYMINRCNKSRGLTTNMKLLSLPLVEGRSRAKESLLLDNFSSTNQLVVCKPAQDKSTTRVILSRALHEYQCICGESFPMESRLHLHLNSIINSRLDGDAHGYLEVGKVGHASLHGKMIEGLHRESSENSQENVDGENWSEESGSLVSVRHTDLVHLQHSTQSKTKTSEGKDQDSSNQNQSAQDDDIPECKNPDFQVDKNPETVVEKNPDVKLMFIPDSKKKKNMWYGCSSCPLAFSTLLTYKNHSYDRHRNNCESHVVGPDNLKWACVECGIQYFTEEGYRSHKQRSSRCTVPKQTIQHSQDSQTSLDEADNSNDTDPLVCRSWFHCTLCPKAFSTFPMFYKHKVQDHNHDNSVDFSFKLKGLWKLGQCGYCHRPMTVSLQKLLQKEQMCDDCESLRGQLKPKKRNAPSMQAVWPGIHLEDSPTSIVEKSVTVPMPYLKLVLNQDTLQAGAPSSDNVKTSSSCNKYVTLPNPYVRLVKIDEIYPFLRAGALSKQSSAEQTNGKGFSHQIIDELNSRSEVGSMKKSLAESPGLTVAGDFQIDVKTEPEDCFVRSSGQITQSGDKVMEDIADSKINVNLDKESNVTTTSWTGRRINTTSNVTDESDHVTDKSDHVIDEHDHVTEVSDHVTVKTEPVESMDSELGLTVPFSEGADKPNVDEVDSKENICWSNENTAFRSGFLEGDATEWAMVTPIVTVKEDELSQKTSAAETPSSFFTAESSDNQIQEGDGKLVRRTSEPTDVYLKALLSQPSPVDIQGRHILRLKTNLTGQGNQQNSGKVKSPVTKKAKSKDNKEGDTGLNVTSKSRSKSHSGTGAVNAEQPSSNTKRETKRRKSEKHDTDLRKRNKTPTQVTDDTEVDESEYIVGSDVLDINIKSEPLSDSEDALLQVHMPDPTEDISDSAEIITDEAGTKQEPVDDDEEEEDSIPEHALTNMVFIHKPSEKIFADYPGTKEKPVEQLKNSTSLCKCGICGSGFATMQKLVRHSKTHNTVTKQYKCQLCNKSFKDLSEAIEHKDSHGPREFGCPICKKEFVKSWHLKEHLEIHKNFPSSPGNICNICGSAFPEFSSLRKHMPCHFTDKARGMPGDNLPISSNLNEKNYPCSECDKVFNSRNRRTVHIRYTHRGEPKNPCELCDRSFFTPSELQRHFRTHTGERPFACGVCGKAFALATTLKDHLTSHTGERPFKCSVCGKCYSSSSILGRHKIIHLGIRKHKCTMCDKAFQYSNSLAIHLRTHTKERPYSCDICNKTFTMSCHHRVHMRIHTGEKPYKCKYCDCRFNNYGSHYRHVRTHSEWKDENTGEEGAGNILVIKEVDSVDSSEADDIEGKILPYMLSTALSSPFLLNQAIADKEKSSSEPRETQTCAVSETNQLRQESNEGSSQSKKITKSGNHVSDDKPVDTDVTNSQDITGSRVVPLKLNKISSEKSPLNVKVGVSSEPKPLIVSPSTLKTVSFEGGRSQLTVSVSVREKLKRSLTKSRDAESDRKKCRSESDKEKQDSESSRMSQGSAEFVEASLMGLKQNSAKKEDSEPYTYAKAASSIVLQILTNDDN